MINTIFTSRGYHLIVKKLTNVDKLIWAFYQNNFLPNKAKIFPNLLTGDQKKHIIYRQRFSHHNRKTMRQPCVVEEYR